MKLLFKPLVEADAADNLKVAGARAESEPVQSMQDSLVALKLRGFVGFAYRLMLRWGQSCTDIARRRLRKARNGRTREN